MLSPREIATLIVVKGATERMDDTRIELVVLHALNLIAIDQRDTGVSVVRVTPRGDALLRAIARVS
ncbi:hypothetical protein [Paraburkholderia bannensis]|uniref:hypothetical protein n=1 Tax=Paraburkholderia bannensis TaxID=765414 RepID=UPI002AB7B9CE|nr:hypothetical protein [Paraburkholderia bannensis]